MTDRASDVFKELLSPVYSFFDLRIIWNNPSWHGHRSLEDHTGGDVGPRHFVYYPIAIGIGV